MHCSGSTKLYETKSAIRQLKADVMSMDVLIGARSAALLGKQLGRQQAGKRAPKCYAFKHCRCDVQETPFLFDLRSFSETL